jgi:hypothetical protein
VEWAHNALRLNGHYNTDGTVDGTKVHDTIVLDERVFDPSFRDSRESYHLTQGGAAGMSHKGFGAWRLRGRILVPNASQLASLSDRERAIRSAFDPFQCELDSPTTDGVYGLTWDEPTTDTGTWATGLIPVRIYAKPIRQPTLYERLDDQTVRPFAVDLSAPDPRIFGQTEQALVLTPGSPAGVLTNRGTTRGPVKATIQMTGGGVGSASFQIQNNTSGVTFQLNLSTLGAAHLIEVWMETSGPYGRGRRVHVDTTSLFSIKLSDAASWLDTRVGANTFTIVNNTNIATCTIATYHAWA